MLCYLYVWGGSFLLLSGLHPRVYHVGWGVPISALQVTGISPSGSRSCDYISSPCIDAFRTTLYFYFYMASSNTIQQIKLTWLRVAGTPCIIVCSVHRGDTMSTLEGISWVHRGGYHEYIGGDIMSTSGGGGGYHEYIGGNIMSTSGGYHDACGGYHEYIGGCSVHWGIPWVHRGMFSTLGDVQYIGGYHEYIGGYHEYIGGCSVHRGDIMIHVGEQNF